MSVLIIAEAGVNHNGSFELAMQLVEAAAKAGADVVKFQTFKAKNLVTQSAQQASYQTENTGKSESQLAMLQRLELAYDDHHKLVNRCQQLEIEFLSTAFDHESLSFLVNDLGLTRLKIPSGELTNAPLLLAHAQTGADLIVSTGMATLGEVEQALGVIAYGYLESQGLLATNLPANQMAPSPQAFAAAYASAQGQALIKQKVVILHCTTEYPAPFETVNLKAMDTLKAAFDTAVGYSDHTAGLSVSIAAAARGACLIEKHFTLDQGLPGPDHKASITPVQLADMVTAIREVSASLGSPIKGPQPVEITNKLVARKSLVAIADIAKGEPLTEHNLGVKRPGNGMSPDQYWGVLGSNASQFYQAGALIDE